MLQAGGQLDLAEESIGAQGRGKLGPEQLDRHGAMVLQILGEIDRRHAAGPDFPLDLVPLGKRRLELVECRHELGRRKVTGEGGM